MDETKICKRCGKLLPIEKFRLKTGVFKNPYYSGICKPCEVDYDREHKKKLNTITFPDNVDIFFEREFKTIHPSRILDMSDIDITLLGTDEIFAQMIDYRNTYISNYGRMIRRSYGKCNLLTGSYDNNGNLYYNTTKNVFFDGKWIYKQTRVYASRAVVDTFIVNMDQVQNRFIWHSGNDKDDNYYKNLYPLNQEQYRIVRQHFTMNGDVSEDFIIRTMNDIRFMPDEWCRRDFQVTMAGVGFHGYGEYDISCDAYKKWKAMLHRCYNPKIHKNYPKYKDCTVCKEWWNYQNFRLWYEEHNFGNKILDLDKDILIKGNNVYSPETCCLVPHEINTLFLCGDAKRGEYPLGVWLDDDKEKYRSCVNVFGKVKKLGTFDTIEEAFEKYKTYKMDLIQTMADSYKDSIPEKVYNAMLNWTIEITD